MSVCSVSEFRWLQPRGFHSSPFNQLQDLCHLRTAPLLNPLLQCATGNTQTRWRLTKRKNIFFLQRWSNYCSRSIPEPLPPLSGLRIRAQRCCLRSSSSLPLSLRLTAAPSTFFKPFFMSSQRTMWHIQSTRGERGSSRCWMSRQSCVKNM